jgi:mRNA interferase MazF
MQGEIWEVEFMPQRGVEIGKTRPAVVVNSLAAGILPLRIVVPITDWKPAYSRYFWFTLLAPSLSNGLQKLSGADAFQVKSVSTDRFVQKIGVVLPRELQSILEAVVLCLEQDSL